MRLVVLLRYCSTLCFPVNDIFSITLHCEGLTRTGRAIDEDGTVLTVDKGVAQIESIDVVENFLLGRLRVKHFLK